MAENNSDAAAAVQVDASDSVGCVASRESMDAVVALPPRSRQVGDRAWNCYTHHLHIYIRLYDMYNVYIYYIIYIYIYTYNYMALVRMLARGVGDGAASG